MNGLEIGKTVMRGQDGFVSIVSYREILIITNKAIVTFESLVYSNFYL